MWEGDTKTKLQFDKLWGPLYKPHVQLGKYAMTDTTNYIFLSQKSHEEVGWTKINKSITKLETLNCLMNE